MVGSRAEEMVKRLREMQNATPEIEASAVVSVDGLTIASALPSDVEEDRVSAMSAAMLSLGERIAVELNRSLTGENLLHDLDIFPETITDRTRLIILNTPHNPTGSVWTDHDIQQLREVIEEKDIYILSDEVYEHILFDDRQHCSLLRYPSPKPSGSRPGSMSATSPTARVSKR